jgi:putative glutamine amidotransferase
MNPLILVTADVREADRFILHSAIDIYLKALAGVGATPLILPSLAGDIDLESLLGRIDGVLTTGARSNVHPRHYGDEPTAGHEPYDHDRDATTLDLIRKTIGACVPLLAICRGFQELNVALGGTLDTEIQELEGRADHRAPATDDHDVRFGLAHEVEIEPGSTLAAIVGTKRLAVNSSHRQAVRDLAPGLIAEAFADDGTVEAVRVKDAGAFALGVQWHPEYRAGSDPASRALFTAFRQAATETMTRRAGDHPLPAAAQ